MSHGNREIVVSREVDLDRIILMIRRGVSGLSYAIPAQFVDRLLAKLQELAEAHKVRIRLTVRSCSGEQVFVYAAVGGVAGATVGTIAGGLVGAVVGGAVGAAAGVFVAAVDIRFTYYDGSDGGVLELEKTARSAFG